MADINERLMNGAGLAELWSLIGNKYNGVYEHWWKRRSSVTGAVQETANLSELAVNTLSGSRAKTFYADSYTADTVAGVFALTNPVNWAAPSTVNSLKGKYVMFDGSSGTEMYYVPANASSEATTTLTTVLYGAIVQHNIFFVTDTGAWGYVSSENRNAYPDIGVSGNWEYEYLGMPFENARECVRVQTGTYVGTGTNKEAGANSITFDFVPKIIFFHTFGKSSYHSPFAFLSVGDLTSEYKAHAFTTYDGNDTENANYAKIVGTTVSWYTTTSASGFVGNAQMNTSGATYYWIAIG